MIRHVWLLSLLLPGLCSLFLLFKFKIITHCSVFVQRYPLPVAMPMHPRQLYAVVEESAVKFRALSKLISGWAAVLIGNRALAVFNASATQAGRVRAT